jgi:5S rRNA maturation endonuclease (ribonuclease M5)
MIKIRNRQVHIDILEELQQFQWKRAEVRGVKWLACSPFRPEERHPSFAVNLENGLYIDSALDDEYWRKGSFQKLLAFLLGCNVQEAEDFLLEKYSPFYRNVNELQLKLHLSIPPKRTSLTLDNGIFEQFNHKNPYLLAERRIDQQVLDEFKVGFDPHNNLSVFIWSDKSGQPINAKFRKNTSKKFFYLKNAAPVGEHVYLLHDFFQNEYDTGYITESEIDSLYIRSLGKEFPAVALGGSNVSKEQERLLLTAPVRNWVLCTDNDKQGHRISKNLAQKLNGYKKVEKIHLPEHIKDVNELPLEELRSVLKARKAVGFSFLV